MTKKLLLKNLINFGYMVFTFTGYDHQKNVDYEKMIKIRKNFFHI